MSRTSRITALYERLSRDDDLTGERVILLPIKRNTSKTMPVGMALKISAILPMTDFRV